MSLREWGALLRRRWKWALAAWLLTVAATVAGSLLLPPQYTAVASVVLDGRPDPIAGSYPGLMAPGIVATQVDVMQSERVAQRVVRNLRLADQPAWREAWQDDTAGRVPIVPIEPWLVDAIGKGLELRPSRESNVIVVAYRARDARLAAAMANGYVQAYLDTVVELRVDPARQFSDFFDVRSREARQALERAQARLSAFQQEEGLVAGDERLDVETRRLDELVSQLVAVQGLGGDSASRMRTLGHRPAEEMPEMLAHPLVAGLRSDLVRLQARLSELDARVGEAHPQRLEVLASMEEVQARLQAEVRRLAGGLAAADDINRQRERTLQGSLAAQRQRMLHLKAVRDQAAVLQRDVENAQRAYDALLGRLQLVSLESQTNQTQAHRLSTAVPPIEPTSPRLALNVALSVALGALLALAVALVLEGRAARQSHPARSSSGGWCERDRVHRPRHPRAWLRELGLAHRLAVGDHRLAHRGAGPRPAHPRFEPVDGLDAAAQRARGWGWV